MQGMTVLTSRLAVRFIVSMAVGRCPVMASWIFRPLSTSAMRAGMFGRIGIRLPRGARAALRGARAMMPLRSSSLAKGGAGCFAKTAQLSTRVLFPTLL